MKYTREKINEIYNNLKAGYSYSNGFSGMYYYNGYIHWNNFGSSAIKDSKKELKWLLEVIFDDVTPDDFEKKYKKGHDFVYA